MNQTLQIVLISCIGCLLGASARAQEPKLEFEAASVRASDPAADTGPLAGIADVSGGPGTQDPGRVAYTHVYMRILLTTAFHIEPDQLVGPAWALDANMSTSQKFDVVASVPAASTKEQVNEMLKNLLIQRFGLAYHLEKKPFEVYELTVAKGGPKLTPAEIPAAPPESLAPGTPLRARMDADDQGFPRAPAGSGRLAVASDGKGHTRLAGRSVRIAAVLRMLTATRLGTNHVVDKTGLTGKYDIKLEFSQFSLAEPLGPGAGASTDSAPAENAADPVPDLVTALEKQLGLKLQKTKVALDVVVIDHIEKVPVEN